MKKGGIGGANTVTGLRYEEKVNFLTMIAKVPGYEVRENEIFYEGKYLASSFPKHSLYNTFLQSKGVDYKQFVSKQYLPDEAIYVPSQNTLYVIEMKFQTTEGSVDEKLQTADFKRKIYLKLTSQLKLNVEYALLLSDFFDKPKYADSFQYINEVGCTYFINELKLSWLKFPEPVVAGDAQLPVDVEVTN